MSVASAPEPTPPVSALWSEKRHLWHSCSTAHASTQIPLCSAPAPSLSAMVHMSKSNSSKRPVAKMF